MRKIPTKTHGIMDYLMGVLLIAAPWIFGFARGGTETWVPVIFGTASIIYSLLTEYEYGLFNTLSISAHLTFDTWLGIFLAGSPWIFGFNEFVYLPHLILGIIEIAAVLATERAPSVAGHAADGNHRHAH